MAAGAGEIKTDEEVGKYGGMANAQLDPCYHRSCDTINNINQNALRLFSSSLAHVLECISLMGNLSEFLETSYNRTVIQKLCI